MKQIPATRVARSRKRAIDSWRGRAGAALPRLRTWLERSLDDEQVDIVWFATNYAEECNRPFVLTVFDIEHARQPWFPEVSRAGEWERREAHYSRYVPNATRVIVPNAVGRAQLERYYAIEREAFAFW